MSTGAQSTLNVPNFNGWGCDVLGSFDEDGGQVNVAVEFYHVALPNPRRIVITVTNTTSTRLSRNGAATGYDDLILVQPGGVATPAGFTNALNGWRGGASKNARQKGLADALLAAGIVDASLGGTTS